MAHPVIVLIDNDDGATKIFNFLRSKKFNITIDYHTDLPFYHLSGPLYLVKTPAKGDDDKSCPEDFFDPALLATKLDGKSFNPDKEHDAPGEYGKVVFAERVVRPQTNSIDFSGFEPLLSRIDAVIEDYDRRKAATPTTPSPTPRTLLTSAVPAKNVAREGAKAPPRRKRPTSKKNLDTA